MNIKYFFMIFCFIFSQMIALAKSDTYLAPNNNASEIILNIYGTTDRLLFPAFIYTFQTLYPNVTITYQELESGAIFNGIVQNNLTPSADLVISSAVDLQVKLANDGYAISYYSPYFDDVPDWAHWQQEIYGFTYEPAVIAYNRRLIKDEEAPRTHLQLAKLLEEQKEKYRGKIGTYNIATSGVGYVLASHDEMISSNFWRLTNAFAGVEAKLSASSPLVLDWLENGEIAIAYNLLGSYAFARAMHNEHIGVIVPDDYALVLTRSTLTPKTSQNIEYAQYFIDFLLSSQGQELAAGTTGFGAIMPNVKGEYSQQSIMKKSRGIVQPIIMSPTLLVAYDQQKRAQFLHVWLDLIANSSAFKTYNPSIVVNEQSQ